MQIDINPHIEETTLERYSIGSLEEEAAAEVEQHLLLCETCQTRVTEADAYIHAIKAAVPGLPPEPERQRWSFRILLPAFAVCALLVAAAVVRFSPSVERPPTPIALYAMRGADVQARGPARRPLLLRPDLTGLPAASSYQLDLVNASGSLAWRGVLSNQGQPPGAIVPPLSRGFYFLRVSSTSGELLREYSLELRGRD
jgi:anti-sigma factor RsiW